MPVGLAGLSSPSGFLGEMGGGGGGGIMQFPCFLSLLCWPLPPSAPAGFTLPVVHGRRFAFT